MKKQIFLMVYALFLCTISAHAQYWQWARQNTDGCYVRYSAFQFIVSPFVSTDVFGNVYVFGNYFCENITFGTYSITNPSMYGEMYLLKYDSSGNVKWLQNIGTEVPNSGANLANGIATDAAGNIYITGLTGDANFTCGSVTVAANGVFLAKVDSGGNTIWAKSKIVYGGASLSVDNSGHIYVTNRGIIVSKIDSSGDSIWSRVIVDNIFTPFNNIPSIASDNLGNVFLAGSTEIDTLYIDSFILPFTIAGSFLVKYDSTGNLQWAKKVGDSSSFLFAEACDAAGNVYVCGYNSNSSNTFGTTTLFGVGSSFIVKYNSLGNVIWAKTVNIEGPFPITVYNYNNIYIAGWGSVGGSFLENYDSSGSLIWTKNVNDSGTAGGDITFSAIATNTNGSIYITGSFGCNLLWFGSDTLHNPFSLFADWWDDIFLAKLGYGHPVDASILTPANNNIVIYPNPTEGMFTIDIPDFNNHVLITIFDLLGRIIETRSVEIKSTAIQQFNFYGYPTGIYFVKANVDGIICNKKIILK